MYYKVLKNGKVIDVLDGLVFLKYQKKHNHLLLCSEQEAQVILSSDGKNAYHERSLLPVPVDKYDTVELEEVDVYEYRKLKALNMKTPEEIIDAYTLSLLEGGIL